MKPNNCRILYAEDNEDSSTMMKVRLGLAGIEMVAANTISEIRQLVQEALEKLKKKSAAAKSA